MAGVVSLCFNPKGSRIAWVSSQGEVQQWLATTNRVALLTQCPSSGLVQYSLNGEMILVGGQRDGKVRGFSASGNLKGIVSGGREGAVLDIFDGVHKKIIAVGEGKRIHIVNFDGFCTRTLLCGDIGVCGIFGNEGTVLYTGGLHGEVLVWTVDDGRCVRKFRARRARIGAIVAHRGLLAVGGWDGWVKVWALQGGLCLGEWCAHSKQIHSMDIFGPQDAMRLVTGGADDLVRIWDISRKSLEIEKRHRKRDPLCSWPGHTASVFCCAFSPDGQKVASGSRDGTIRLWDVPRDETVISAVAKGSPLQHEGNLRNETSFEGARYDVEANVGTVTASTFIAPYRSGKTHSLLYRPSTNNGQLACPICAEGFDVNQKLPMVSGVCGHTFACRVCNDQLWNGDASPLCPICRAKMNDVAPNYELVHLLDKKMSSGTQARNSTGMAEGTETDEHYIPYDKLEIRERPEFQLGAGGFATVYQGRLDGEGVACKIAMKTSDRVLNTEAERQIVTEFKRLCKLRHPSIIQLFGLSRTPPPANGLIIVSELLPGGSLEDNLSTLRANKCMLSNEAALSISAQLARGLRFLHSKLIAHLDLKPSNVLLSDNVYNWLPSSRAKMCDFGGTWSIRTASQERRQMSTVHLNAASMTGTLAYTAPEILDTNPNDQKQSNNDFFLEAKAADVFSFGMTLFEIFSGVKAWDGYRPTQIITAIVGGQRPGRLPASAPQEIQYLMNCCWAQDSTERPTAEEISHALDRVPSAPELPPD